MPFTTEPELRLRLQLTDTTLAPAALIEQCIEDAHEIVLARLSSNVNTGAPPARLIRGECLLAGALALQALAARDALVQQQISIGGQRLEAGERFSSLRKAASETESRAWELLAEFCTAYPPAIQAAATTTQEIFQH